MIYDPNANNSQFLQVELLLQFVTQWVFSYMKKNIPLSQIPTLGGKKR